MGAFGLYGRYIQARFAADPRHQVITVGRRPAAAHCTTTHVQADLGTAATWDQLLDRTTPTVVINCAAIADVDAVERQPEAAQSVNVDLPIHLANVAPRKGFLFVHFSSNAVYDGRHAPYDEAAPFAPLHRYGRMKASVDRALREERGPVTIVRPTVGYGWPSAVGRQNPLTSALRAMARGEHIRQVTDQFENPVYAGDVAEVVWRVATQAYHGEVNVAGADLHLSRHAWITRVVGLFGYDADRVATALTSDFPSLVARPRDTTFDCTRLRADLGVRTKTVEEGARAMLADAPSPNAPPVPSV